MKTIHYMSSLFSVLWIVHFEYDMFGIEDPEHVQDMISKDYTKYLKSFSAQMNLTPEDCIKNFLNNELDK